MLQAKIERLLKRLSTVEERLGLVDIASCQDEYRKLAQEHSRLNEIKERWQEWQAIEKQQQEQRQWGEEESDPSLVELIEQEKAELIERKAEVEKQLEDLLIPPGADDDKNTILELRMGTGGDEAAIFAGDCVRMYQLYAQLKGWKWSLLSAAPSDLGGYKEYIASITGKGVYRYLQYEAGIHRVQRVPDTESQGRVHTSAISVAVLPEPDAQEEVQIDPKEIRIDTYRSQGAGGQHVNTTDSAVRITHLQTGIVVTSQQEKSQHQNREIAMRVLVAKIRQKREEEEARKRASARASQIGGGDRSEKIRTYNYPQNRVTDHRANVTSYNLNGIMNGQLDLVVLPVFSHFQQQFLDEENGNE